MDGMGELRGAALPNSLEAERSVLGAMLQDSNAVLRAAESLTKQDFYQPQHQEIFDAMLALQQQHQPVDLVTLDAELQRRGTAEGVGGLDYLIGLQDYVPTTANVKAYIDIVAEKGILRRLISAGQEIAQKSYAQQEPVPDILNMAEKSIFDIAMHRSSGDSLVPVREVLYGTYAMIEELTRNRGKLPGVGTGFLGLDNLLTGMHGGELILVGARPSMGKTSFALNIAGHAAFVEQAKVAFFSLEMPREQIAMRLLCSEARVDMQKVRQGTLAGDDWMRLAKAIGPMSSANLYIDDSAAITPTQLRSRCQRLMMDKGLDLIVLDYLGLMRTDGKPENRQLEVSEISRQLKAIALELKIPVVACAQLSRAATARPDKRPVLSDLRDSGSIEQDADVVMFLHREAYYNPDAEEKNVAEVILAKQRNGPLGTVKLGWMSEYATFRNLAPGAQTDTPY